MLKPYHEFAFYAVPKLSIGCTYHEYIVGNLNLELFPATVTGQGSRECVIDVGKQRRVGFTVRQ